MSARTAGEVGRVGIGLLVEQQPRRSRHSRRRAAIISAVVSLASLRAACLALRFSRISAMSTSPPSAARMQRRVAFAIDARRPRAPPFSSVSTTGIWPAMHRDDQQRPSVECASGWDCRPSAAAWRTFSSSPSTHGLDDRLLGHQIELLRLAPVPPRRHDQRRATERCGGSCPAFCYPRVS